MAEKSGILRMFRLMDEYYGDLGWWPGESAFEVMIGAILTQNTSWANVEKAITRLKKEKMLTVPGILKASPGRLQQVLRPAGYFRVKAGRLKEFCAFLMRECGGKVSRLKKRRTRDLREQLLDVKGIGPETADSILVYALEKPVFVVDAYTKRIFARHKIIEENAGYDEIQSEVHVSFPVGVKGLNQFHAMIVETGKRFCKKKKPLCEGCPLGVMFKGKRQKVKVKSKRKR